MKLYYVTEEGRRISPLYTRSSAAEAYVDACLEEDEQDGEPCDYMVEHCGLDGFPGVYVYHDGLMISRERAKKLFEEGGY